MGYHKVSIEKGILGDFSKIREEFQELQDAHEQKCKILIMCELTDLFGAIEEYAIGLGVTIDDLRQFSDMTKSAFREGKR